MSLKGLLAVAALVPLAVLGASSATAANGAGADRTPSTTRTARAAHAPSGYVVVRTKHDLPEFEQVYGEADCPKGKVPLGGGVYISGRGFYRDINSSYPRSFGWVAEVNGGYTESTFYVYAVCANPPANYERVEGAPVTVPSNRSISTFVSCQRGRVLSGGVVSSSSEIPTWITNIQPTETGAEGVSIQHTNLSDDSERIRGWAVCGDLPHHRLVQTSFSVGPQAQRGATATCPSGVAVGGGGGQVWTDDPQLRMNTSYPGGGGWQAFFNNGDLEPISVTVYAVCAT